MPEKTNEEAIRESIRKIVEEKYTPEEGALFMATYESMEDVIYYFVKDYDKALVEHSRAITKNDAKIASQSQVITSQEHEIGRLNGIINKEYQLLADDQSDQ